MVELACLFLPYYNKNNHTHTKIKKHQLNQSLIALFEQYLWIKIISIGHNPQFLPICHIVVFFKSYFSVKHNVQYSFKGIVIKETPRNIFYCTQVKILAFLSWTFYICAFKKNGSFFPKWMFYHKRGILFWTNSTEISKTEPLKSIQSFTNGIFVSTLCRYSTFHKQKNEIETFLSFNSLGSPL